MPAQSAASDELLIQKFKDGNADAFTALYERHLASVYNRVRYVVPEEEVEDITQEVFIAAVKSIHTFRGEAQFGTWLRTLTNYKVAEYYRKRNRKREALQVPLSASIVRDGDTAHLMEERIAVRKALNQISESYREVILLRFAEGLQFHEIAELTGLSLEATKSLFRRAISALRSQLDESQ
ncbi:MAG TPA: sigma-70 family RNA polymerase sigma factor [Anaerolineales bacterium]|nr:sigma-70 family RNA polymerase sigma factor [Anaerolineales bacterium]